MLIGYVRVSKSDGTQTLAPHNGTRCLRPALIPPAFTRTSRQAATMPALG
jgi:hypothetical protein